MGNNEDVIVKPYKLDRVCVSSPNIDQLTLKEIDNAENVYSRKLVKLSGASLPDAVQQKESSDPNIISWDLFLTLKYRQEWKPSGYGLGELLFATSLMPDEELTLEVKTWETSKTQQDTEDTTDVRNVSDIKQSMSAANEVTTGQEIKTNQHIDAKASYSGWGFSASVEAGWAQDVNEMQQEVAKEAQETSEQSTNEYRSTRKVKMAVSREQGSESKTTRVVKNINQAHTLNVNYFEVLREYNVSLNLYAANLMLLGSEVNLNDPIQTLGAEDQQFVLYLKKQPEPEEGPDTGITYPPDWKLPDGKLDPGGYTTGSSQGDDQGDVLTYDLTLGQMIRYSASAPWVQNFINKFGISPIKILWEKWATPLYEGALFASDISDDQVVINPEDRETFQNNFLKYVRPSDGWVEIDEKGKFRWAYEVRAGAEKKLLEYMYKFLPYGVQQTIERARNAGMELESAYKAVAARHVEAISVRSKPTRSFNRSWNVVPKSTGATTPLKVEDTKKILVKGPFNGVIISKLESSIDDWTDETLDQLKKVREKLGKQNEWTTLLPTQGVYADLALGVCSGAEDYYEIQRQYDLELKSHEIKKIELEIERLKLQNSLIKQGRSPHELTIDNPGGDVDLKVKVDCSKDPLEVKVKDGGP